MSINPRPSEKGEMLYAYTSLAGKFDDARLVGARRIEEWFHGAKWRYCISRVDD